MYSPALALDGYDRNFSDEADQVEWLAYYDALVSTIFQPTLGPSTDPRAVAVPFYGYDSGQPLVGAVMPRKRFDILYVGQNLWRWRQISRELLPALEYIRDRVGEIGFRGLWWDRLHLQGPPWELAYEMDPERLQHLRIRVEPPVPYTEVIAAMGEGRIHIMTQRPLLRHFKHLTAKYFEIFTADTIPLVMLDPAEMGQIYGPMGRELSLSGDIAAKLIHVFNREADYREIVEEVRLHLAAHHSYRCRVEQLVAALEELTA